MSSVPEPREAPQALDGIDTPACILDFARLERNIRHGVDTVARFGIAMRPHLKTCKSWDVTRCLLDIAADTGLEISGATVSTVAEAEYFAGHGIEDIFYAVNYASGKMRRLARLIREGTDVSISVDHLRAAEAAAADAAEAGVVVRVLIEIDLDGVRGGIDPTGPAFDALARFIHESPHLTLCGLMSYGGAAYDMSDRQRIAALAEQHRLGLLQTAERLRASGLPCDVLSFGGSPATYFAETLEGLTETRIGVFVFGDVFQAALGLCAMDDIAISVLTTVIGQQSEHQRWLVDAGGLALSQDRSTRTQAVDQGYGVVCDYDGRPIDDLIVTSVSQEHGVIESRSGSVPIDRIEPGARLRILPNHACMTAAAYEGYHVVGGGSDVIAWWPRRNGW